MSLPEMHFEQRLKESTVTDKIAQALRPELKAFFDLGMDEKANDVRSIVETLQANINNEKLSDEDFRKLTDTVVQQLLAKL